MVVAVVRLVEASGDQRCYREIEYTAPKKNPKRFALAGTVRTLHG